MNKKLYKEWADMYAAGCVNLLQVKEYCGRFLPQYFWDCVARWEMSYHEYLDRVYGAPNTNY